ncbi:hypothetical protein AGDE_14591 [Angomonas deanei]|uniref:Uncharacterized protein n=1 Tax=Angomonas deanei TaxID=59799 RepID=A0A7G2CT02_9TRYP|nr:hypothetical protein AGDE_14591 [Angomonas deanei]CAD2222064.1 hypothetical protein, conserved [Angomonas deanei]|eukprot:EPY20577.1 hypothetical protein AGDE_14591 [Angomonas deanei]
MFASVAHPPAGEDADEMEEDFTARHSTILTAAPSREDLSLTPRNRDVRVMERFAGVSATARVITVGYIQLRSSLLFALKAVDPLCGADPSSEELHAQSSENISTSVVFKRRWLFKHPDLHDEPPHVTTWTALCTCNMLPIYGMRSAYPRDAFYTIPPHQYTIMDHATSRGQLSEFIIQRLQQQYQLVVDSASEEATFPLVWPREEPTANARVELSAGHQVHLLKIGETLQTLSVTRLLHRGMYSNGQVVHMLSYKYCLWNYLEDCFSPRRVYLEAQVGESNSYSWEELDRWLQSRPDAFIPRGPQLYLRPREIALVLVPLDPSKPPSFQSFLQFISYRFSALLSVRGKVEWKPDSRTLLYREKKDDSQPDDSLMNVILSHDSTQVLERRTTVDPRTGAVVSYEVPVEERMMSVDITLPPRYHPHCCYPLKVDWLVCSASIVSDWYGSFIANANRHGFKAIPVPSDYQSLKSELLSVEWSVVCRQEKNAPTARQKLCEVLLSDETDYYVDHLSLHAEVAMRLVHISGLCYVVLPRLTESGVIAQWHQNSAVATGTLEQQKLLSRFSTLVGRTIGDLL